MINARLRGLPNGLNFPESLNHKYLATNLPSIIHTVNGIKYKYKKTKAFRLLAPMADVRIDDVMSAPAFFLRVR